MVQGAMHPSSVTIFGGTGFIGRAVVRRLAKLGCVIRIPTRDMDKALPLKPAGDVGQIVPFLSSLRSEASVAAAVAGADTVINLVGILFESGQNSFQSVHVETAARIARIAQRHNVKNFVHLSALGADGNASSAYARSKAAGEDAVRAFFPEAVILRPSIVFGPEDNFFNRFAALARFTPALPLIGGGATRFQPVYVGDVAEAVVAALTRPEARGQAYELGGPNVYSFRELMTLMLGEVRRKRCLVTLPFGAAKLQASLLELLPNPLLTRDQVELLKSDNILHPQHAKTLRDLGLTPTPLETILPTYMDAYRAGGRWGAAA